MPGDYATLETLCEAMDKSGDGQIEIVVTDDFRGDEKEEFANKLFRSWGIGHKGKNDGVLVVLSPKMRKWRIEVGYGLEGRLTDAQAAQIGRNYGVPAWKNAQWGAGLFAVSTSIAAQMHAEVKVAPPPPRVHSDTPSTFAVVLGICLSVVAIGLFVFLMRRSERKREEEAREEERRQRERAEYYRSQAKVSSFSERQVSRGVAPRQVVPKPALVPQPAPAPVVQQQTTVVVVEEHQHHKRRDDTPPRSSSSSDSSSSFDSGFSGGGGGDSGGGGAGGDF